MAMALENRRPGQRGPHGKDGDAAANGFLQGQGHFDSRTIKGIQGRGVGTSDDPAAGRWIEHHGFDADDDMHILIRVYGPSASTLRAITMR